MREINVQQGYAALATVVVVGALAGIVIMNMVSVGVLDTQISVIRQQHAYAQSAADGCVEYALQRVRDGITTETGIQTFTHASCEYTLSESVGIEIQSEGISRDAHVYVEVNVSEVSPFIVVESWEYR